MKFSKPIRCVFPIIALALGTYGLAESNTAVEITPPEIQSDARISVWANNAPLSVFVTQLASITGRDVSIDGDIPGEVSGRFNGSMTDTLLAVSDQFPVIFDMSSSSLSVAPESAKTTATVALGNSVVDDELLKSMLADSLEGNAIEVRDGEVVISGHPSFVKRVAGTVLKNGISKSDDPLPADAIQPEQAPVVDIAAQFMLDDDITEAASAVPTQTASAVQAAGATTVVRAETATALQTEATAAVHVETAVSIQSENTDAVQLETAAAVQSEITDAAQAETVATVQPERAVAIQSETSADTQSEATDAVQAEATSNTRSIRWVTDIPGFDTF